MDEAGVAALLRDASSEVPVHDPPTAAIMRAGRRRTTWRRVGAAVLTASVVTVAVVVPRLDQDRAEPGPTPPAVGPGCVGRPSPAVLPDWARAGFSDPEPRAPYVTSGSGELVAILFGGALYAPPKAGQSNKILWVTSVPDTTTGPLRISARRDGTAETVTREVPNGPGPSTVDLPSPGCWHLTLRWGRTTDTIDLRYLSP